MVIQAAEGHLVRRESRVRVELLEILDRRENLDRRGNLEQEVGVLFPDHVPLIEWVWPGTREPSRFNCSRWSRYLDNSANQCNGGH